MGKRMKEIPLSQGKVALVDDEDFEFLSQWKWRAYKGRNTFYVMRSIRKPDGKWTTIRMHQVLAEKMGFKHWADHIDGNGLNNQRHNLQDLTNKQNQEKARRRKDNTSGHKGVSWNKQRSKWRAQIHNNGKQKNLGRFDKLEDAIAARKAGEKKYFHMIA
jgi:hypothetical protein